MTANAESASVSQADDAFERIRKLGQLRDEGLITAEEFEANKAELVGKL